MRTTIHLDDALLARLKQRAAATGRTMTSLVEDAVREMLARADEPPATARRIRLPTFGGDGVLPGIDIDNNASVLDAMDGIR